MRNYNLINQRQFLLLDNLLRHPDTFFTTDNFAEEYGVTSRTIKNDISLLRNFLSDTSVVIESRHGKGIWLKETKEDAIKLLLNEMRRGNNLGSARSSERQLAFLAQEWILLNDNWFTVSQLSSSLGVSVSVLNHSMEDLKTRFANYNIKFVTSTAYGSRVEGSEQQFRACWIDYYIDSLSRFEDVLATFQKGLYKKIEVVIVNNLKANNLYITPIFLERFITALIVTLYRSNNHQYVTDTPANKKLLDKPIQKICQKILSELDIHLPVLEEQFLAAYLLSCISFPNKDTLDCYYSEYLPQCQLFIEDCIRFNKNKFGIVFDKTELEQLKKVICENLLLKDISQFQRLFDREIRNFIRTEPVALELAYQLGEAIKEKYNLIISRRFHYSFGLLYYDYLSKNHPHLNKRYNVAIQSNYDSYFSHILAKKLSNLSEIIDKVVVVNDFSEKKEDFLYLSIDDPSQIFDGDIPVNYSASLSSIKDQIFQHAFQPYDQLQIKEIKIEQKVSVDELLWMIAKNFNTERKAQQSCYDFMHYRNNVIGYDNAVEKTIFIILFNQQLTGRIKLSLNQSMLFQNWNVDTIYVFSIESNSLQLAQTDEIIHYYRKNLR